MTQIKKYIVIFLLISFSFSFSTVSLAQISSPSAEATSTEDTGDETPTETPFEKLKRFLSDLVALSVNRLNIMEEKISTNPYLTQEEKNQIIKTLNDTEAVLVNYQNGLPNAATLAELQVLNQEVVQYLLDNKDVIRDSAHLAIFAIAKDALDKAEDLLAKSKLILGLLRFTCPSEKAAIAKLDGLTIVLQTEIDELRLALNNEDVPAILQNIGDIARLGKEIIPLMKQLFDNCKIPL